MLPGYIVKITMYKYNFLCVCKLSYINHYYPDGGKLGLVPVFSYRLRWVVSFGLVVACGEMRALGCNLLKQAVVYFVYLFL